jgi:Ca-activated chloride channel family protein
MTSGDELTIDFNDLYAEEEKAVLIKFSLKEPKPKKLKFPLELSYTDVQADNMPVSTKTKLSLKRTDNIKLYDQSLNTKVFQNKVLFLSNAQLEEAMKMVDKQSYDDAKQSIQNNMSYMDSAFGKVAPDSMLLRQYESTKAYYDRIDQIKDMSQQEIKTMQKQNKMYNYDRRKKRKKTSSK